MKGKQKKNQISQYGTRIICKHYIVSNREKCIKLLKATKFEDLRYQKFAMETGLPINTRINQLLQQ